MTLLDEQPAPTPDVGDVWAEIIAETTHPVLRGLYEERRRQGIERHGWTERTKSSPKSMWTAEQERAAVVAFLRETLATSETAYASDDLDYAIAIIERGGHRKEEER